MKEKFTIKDISRELGVSSGTVHRALTGKKGVSDTVRKNILAFAEEKGYKANTAASLLKRKKIKVLVAFPESQGKNRYYYADMWRGFAQYKTEIEDFNIDIIEIAFSENRPLEESLRHYSGIDGILTIGHISEKAKELITDFYNSGVFTVLIGDDYPFANCCVKADYETTGAMVAELLNGQINNPKVLIDAGDREVESHDLTACGFSSCFSKDNIITLYGYNDEEKLYSDILKYSGEVDAIFSVTARGSAVLGRAIRENNINTRGIGSDIFFENSENLKNNVLQNIIYKNPKGQAYLGAKVLFSYLIRDEKPKDRTMFVESVVVFKSNLKMYI